MRRTKDVSIDAEGRDKGKQFHITEMPASRAEDWAVRAFLALAKSGVEVPEDIQAMGFAGLAAFGLQALSGLTFEETKVLMDEMWQCVVYVPDPSKPSVTRALIEDDIEEVATRLKLRKEILSLHSDFFSLENRSTSTKIAAVAGS